MDILRLPADNINNVWFSYRKTDAVIVFVHGVLSCSRTCWLHEDRKHPDRSSYWPEIIEKDERFSNIATFLGGYHTSADAGPYEVRNCVDEFFAALRRPDKQERPPPLAMNKITFVCHSMGGIVTRSMLERHGDTFADKDVGVVLIASPTFGSDYANSLEWLIEFFNNQQGLHLRWGSWSLEDLDDRFRELKASQKIPGLKGVEYYENHFVVHHKWMPIVSKKAVVGKQSLGRYFGPPIQIPNSDHFSICKPASDSSLIHQYLYDFLKDNRLLPSVPERRVAMEISTGEQGKMTSTIAAGSIDPAEPSSENETPTLAVPEGSARSSHTVMSKPDAYHPAAIRKLLTAALADEELVIFCADNFPSVYEQFSTGMSKPQKLQRLLEYCSRYREIPKLLDLLKMANPAAFTEYAQDIYRSHRSG